MKSWKEVDFTIPKSVKDMRLALKFLSSLELEATKRGDSFLSSGISTVILRVRNAMESTHCVERSDDSDVPSDVVVAFTATMNQLPALGRRMFDQRFDDFCEEEALKQQVVVVVPANGKPGGVFRQVGDLYEGVELSPQNVDALLHALSGEHMSQRATELMHEIHKDRCGLDCACTRVPESLADLLARFLSELPTSLRERAQSSVVLQNTVGQELLS